MTFNIKLAVKNAMLGLRGVPVELPMPTEPIVVVEEQRFTREYMVKTQILGIEEELLNTNTAEFRKVKEATNTQNIADELASEGIITHAWNRDSEGRLQVVSRVKVVPPKKH